MKSIKSTLTSLKNSVRNHKLLAALAGAVLLLLILFFALRGPEEQTQAAAPPPVDVEVTQVEQQDVPIYGEWIGTLDGLVNAEIKAQVTGYLLRQNYTEGSFVKKGQLLFEIDPRPFQAALDQARARQAEAEGQLAQAQSQLAQANAQVLQAQAEQGRTQLTVNRYTPLARENAITQEELDNAVQANRAAMATVQAAQAQVETSRAAITAARGAIAAARAQVAAAQLNLGFTRINSPISGIAGLAQAQIGSLVNAGSNTLTTVSAVDPIRCFFTVTEQEYLQYVRENPTERQREAESESLKLELVLADGSVYPRTGRFYVADRQVDPQTGAIRLAGLFPNPGNLLRPGQYARVRAVTEVKQQALLVPQRAVTELQGTYQVAVVQDDNTVRIQPVQVGERVGSMWVIDQGLQPGERIVAEGTQKVRPGVPVNPLPYTAAAGERTNQ